MGCKLPDKSFGWFIALYILSTMYFAYQHSTGMSWDYTVYALNSRYMFSGGSYFEWERPPLMQTILYALSFMGLKAAEYFYIVFVSALFVCACLRFSKTAKADPLLFYALMLNPYVLNFAFIAGTELLTLSLLMLVVAELDETASWAIMGFALLARYTTIPYMLVFFFKKKPRKIVAGLLIILALFTPWMIYNLALRGNPFYSMVSSFILNVESKGGGFTGPGIESIPLLFFAPFFIIVLLGLLKAYRAGFSDTDRILFVIALLTVLVYVRVPEKELRFLFNINVWMGYYAAFFISKFATNPARRLLLVAVIVFACFTSAAPKIVGFSLTHAFLGMPYGFQEGAGLLDGDCMVMSNLWPQLNYLGVTARAYPPRDSVEGRIREGYRILLFYGGDIPKPDYMFDDEFIKSLEVIEWNDDLLLLGDESLCAAPESVDEGFLYYYGMENGVKLCPMLPLLCPA